MKKQKARNAIGIIRAFDVGVVCRTTVSEKGRVARILSYAEGAPSSGFEGGS